MMILTCELFDLSSRYGAGGFGARDYRQFERNNGAQRNMTGNRQPNGPAYGNVPQGGYPNYAGPAGMPNYMVAAYRGASYGGNYNTGATATDWWGQN